MTQGHQQEWVRDREEYSGRDRREWLGPFLAGEGKGEGARFKSAGREQNSSFCFPLVLSLGVQEGVKVPGSSPWPAREISLSFLLLEVGGSSPGPEPGIVFRSL